MDLFIVRHGETLENLSRFCHGHEGGHLSSLGIKQAERIAFRLKDFIFDFIYSSDLKRAYDTSKRISSFHPDTKFILDKRLRERDLSPWEGKPFPEVVDWNNLPDGCESNSCMLDRAKSFINFLKENHSGDSILLVSHGGFIKSLVTSIDPKHFPMMNTSFVFDNTSLSHFKLNSDGTISGEFVNDTSHLN